MLNNWGRGRGDYLWRYKWFYGMLLRKRYNKIDGLNTEVVRSYHKYDISNTMGIDVLRMDIEEV